MDTTILEYLEYQDDCEGDGIEAYPYWEWKFIIDLLNELAPVQ